VERKTGISPWKFLTILNCHDRARSWLRRRARRRQSCSRRPGTKGIARCPL